MDTGKQVMRHQTLYVVQGGTDNGDKEWLETDDGTA